MAGTTKGKAKAKVATRSGQRIGYVRVSTLDQNTERQLDGVTLDRAFTDKASGKDANRPALQEALRFVRDGDTLIVHSMDRLARNVLDLRTIVEDLMSRGVTVQFAKESLTFTPDGASAMSTLMLNVLGAVAEFERSERRRMQGFRRQTSRGRTGSAGRRCTSISGPGG